MFCRYRIMLAADHLRVCDTIGFDISYAKGEVYDSSEHCVEGLSDELPYRLGSHIKRARYRKRISTVQAAKYFNLRHKNYLNWEQNMVSPKPGYFPEIINFIGYCPTSEHQSVGKRHLLERVYLNGFSQHQQAQHEGISERTVGHRERN